MQCNEHCSSCWLCVTSSVFDRLRQKLIVLADTQAATSNSAIQRNQRLPSNIPPRPLGPPHKLRTRITQQTMYKRWQLLFKYQIDAANLRQGVYLNRKWSGILIQISGLLKTCRSPDRSCLPSTSPASQTFRPFIGSFAHIYSENSSI